MASRTLGNAEIMAQATQARAREASARRRGLRATSAKYDARKDLIMLELSNGALVGFPAQTIADLKGRTPAEVGRVTLSPSGAGIQWDAIDVQVSVVGVLFALFSERERRTELARLAGRVTSAAKTRAARRNGAKGGRPKK
jgi:Protein of unknown function (DUF2442)